MILNGRNLTAPDEAHRPMRTQQQALSKYWVWDNLNRKKVYVPKKAVYRMHIEVAPMKRTECLCLKCFANGRIGERCDDHGTYYSPLPKNVIVLGARNITDGSISYGWYVRFEPAFAGDEKNANHLWRLSKEVVEEITEYLSADMHLCGSLLLTKFPDGSSDDRLQESGMEFESLACLRFSRTLDNMRYDWIWKKNKRKMEMKMRTSGTKCVDESYSDNSPPMRPLIGPADNPDVDEMEDISLGSAYGVHNGDCNMAVTCGVCLEEDNASREHTRCCVDVCDECNQMLRGLCTVCQRTEINARYYCSCCGTLRSLRSFGYPCLHCEQANICSECYCAFGDCGNCDELR